MLERGINWPQPEKMFSGQNTQLQKNPIKPTPMNDAIKTTVFSLSLVLAVAGSAQTTGTDTAPAMLTAAGLVETSLRAEDRAENHGAHVLNDIVGAFPSVPGAVNWTWRFEEPNGLELPLVYQKGDGGRFLRLSDVPGLIVGREYRVFVKPEMVTGETTEFGEGALLAIMESAPTDDPAVDLGTRGLESVSDFTVSPEIVTGKTLTLSFGEWINAHARTTVTVYDRRGTICLRTTEMIAAGETLELELPELRLGHYQVSATNNGNKRGKRIKVAQGRSEDISIGDIAFVDDFTVDPKIVTGKEITLTFGDWVEERARTTMEIRNRRGQVFFSSTQVIEANRDVVLELPELNADYYEVVAMNNGQRRSERIKVNPGGRTEDGAIGDLELVADFTARPTLLTGKEITLSFGDWVDERARTTMEIRNRRGQVFFSSTQIIEPGREVTLEVGEINMGYYEVVATNNGNRRSQRIKIAQERSDERSEASSLLLAESDLKVYPNPAIEREVNVKVGQWVDGREKTVVTIYDDYGRVRAEKNTRLRPGESVLMDVTSLENGDYTVMVVNGRSRRSVRLTVRR